MKISELILKVTSKCNLNCRYCYVFNQGDESYKDDIPFMSKETMLLVIKRINEYCSKNNLKDFLVIFHGGEPLLADKSVYKEFSNNIKKYIPNVDVRLALQTNGTLLTDEWVKLFEELNISVGLSLDGPENATKDRIFRSNNRNAYHEIIQGINLLHRNNYPVSILSVINVEEKPENISMHLKDNHVSFADFLYPDKTYDNRQEGDSQISSWLIELFNLWYNDDSSNKPFIRSFDIIIGLVLGVERGNESVGRRNNNTICIKPNGNIQAVDNLMVCGNEFTKTKYNVFENTIDESLENPLIKKYYYSHTNKELSAQCKKCTIKNICGGGHLAHRYSIENGFDNPSVYCQEIFKLVMHIQNRLIDDMAEFSIGEVRIDKLTMKDHPQFHMQ